ncbi:Protein of unknown function, partial [Gryllus bimaculatus]
SSIQPPCERERSDAATRGLVAPLRLGATVAPSHPPAVSAFAGVSALPDSATPLCSSDVRVPFRDFIVTRQEAAARPQVDEETLVPDGGSCHGAGCLRPAASEAGVVAVCAHRSDEFGRHNDTSTARL